MTQTEILPLVLGQSGALVLAVVGCAVLWRALQAARAELRSEHESRLAEMRQTTRALVEVHQEVNGAIDRLVTVAELMTSGPNPPPSPLRDSTPGARAFVRSLKGPAE